MGNVGDPCAIAETLDFGGTETNGHRCYVNTVCNPLNSQCNGDHCIAALPPLAACALGTANACSSGYFCKPEECGIPTAPGMNLCEDAQHDGQACDSNYDAHACMPCGPGLECIKGICHPVCFETGNCPCGKGYTCTTSTSGDSAPAQRCFVCHAFGDRCNSDEPCCSGDGSICGFGQQCCWPVGHACSQASSTGGCCVGEFCNGAKQCDKCKDLGGTCASDAECCAAHTDLKCVGGKCGVPCVPCAPCIIPESDCPDGYKGSVPPGGGGVRGQMQCTSPSTGFCQRPGVQATCPKLQPVCGTQPLPPPPPPNPQGGTGRYHLIGHQFNRSTIDPTALYDYTFTSAGLPVAVSAQELVWSVLQYTNELIGVDPSKPLSAAADVLLSTTPTTLNTFVSPGSAGPPTTVDAVIAENTQASWYEIKSGAISKTHKIDFTGFAWFNPAMQTVDLSASPFFDVTTHDATIATRSPNQLLYVDFSIVSGAPILGRVDVSAHGSPIAVDNGTDLVFAVMSDRTLAKYTTPALSLVDSTTLPADPVAIDGGRIIPSGSGVPPAEADTVVVVTAPSAAGPGQIRAYPSGNLHPTAGPIVSTFTGYPVALVVTVCNTYAYAYVATTSPNQVVKYIATIPGGPPIETLDLGTATPIALTVTTQSGSVGTGGEEIEECFTPDIEGPITAPGGSTTGVVHVLVQE